MFLKISMSQSKILNNILLISYSCLFRNSNTKIAWLYCQLNNILSRSNSALIVINDPDNCLRLACINFYVGLTFVRKFESLAVLPKTYRSTAFGGNFEIMNGNKLNNPASKLHCTAIFYLFLNKFYIVVFLQKIIASYKW